MSICNAPIEKFSDYIFKLGATHGKDHVFRSLGYNRSHSAELSYLYEQAADERYSRQDFALGMLDQYGQRITIEIHLIGIGSNAHRQSYLLSGWMIQSDGSITLNTPFSGFAR